MTKRSPLRSRSTAGIAILASMLGTACAPDGSDSNEMNPSRAYTINCGMPACGTPLAEFDGTAAYSNAGDTTTGESCNGAGAYGLQYQCVELVMRHFSTHWGLRWYGNARALLDNAPRSTVAVYANGDRAHPPVPGDMLVWAYGLYGHVALIAAVRADAVDIIEQNVCGNGRATLGYDGASIAARWGGRVATGWAHAYANTASPSPPATDPCSTITNCGTCTAQPNCGWCDGHCGVGTSSGPSAIRCGSDRWHWHSGDCAAPPPPPPPPPPDACAAQSNCSACTALPTCGWCNGRCATGTASGPTGVSCGSDRWRWYSRDCTPPSTTGANCAGYNDGLYCGDDYVHGDPNTLYRCTGGVASVEQVCSAGCSIQPAGVNDRCVAASVGATCTGLNNGLYCGNDHVRGDPNTLYRCSAGVASVEARCASGCQVFPDGRNDRCY